MPTPIAMPKLGMTMEEGTVVRWPVALGERVEKGQIVLVIESEKAEVEIEAVASGFFRHVYVAEGELVPCGTLLGAITPGADEPFDADAFRAAEDRPLAKPAAAAAAASAPAATAAPTAARPARTPIAPAARALARRLQLDPERIPGSGPGGRVLKEDVERNALQRRTLVEVGPGVSLEVPTQGEGDPVLLLPGLGTDVSAFARQVPMLAERFQVFGVNPRGVGLSDAPESERYEVATTAADAASLPEAPAHVIGASLGSAAALEMAIASPERVRTLTLVTPFVRASGRLLAVSDAWCRLAAAASPELLAAALLPWFFSSGSLEDETARQRLLRGLAATLARVPALTLARMTAGMREWSGTRQAELADLAVPTLVVTAADDLLTPEGAEVAAAIPGAKHVSVAGAGHAVALESPDAVNEAILAHLV